MKIQNPKPLKTDFAKEFFKKIENVVANTDFKMGNEHFELDFNSRIIISLIEGLDGVDDTHHMCYDPKTNLIIFSTVMEHFSNDCAENEILISYDGMTIQNISLDITEQDFQNTEELKMFKFKNFEIFKLILGTIKK